MRFCLVCKAPQLSASSLCAFCAAGLLRLREPVLRTESAYRARSLFSWRESGPRALSWLVRSLKQKESLLPWRELSSWMLNCFPPPGPSVFVPIPTSHRRNHALGLSYALSFWTGYPVVKALGSLQERQQKGLKGYERQEARFEREIWSFCEENTTVIIVDDVITTGSTVRAAYATLGRPQNCEVWCLMDRRPCALRTLAHAVIKAQ